jgi:hypothetical protein
MLTGMMLAAAAATAQNNINPHTQIRWPINCNGANMTYNFLANTCVPVVLGPNVDPASQITWPPACSSGTYIPATNTCVATGTAANPGGAASQVQYNAGGSTFGAKSTFTFDSSTDILSAAQFKAGAVSFPGSLGAAAYMQTGTASGTVAAGNDSRFLAITSGVPGFATQAALFANLAFAAGTVAYVGNDPTLALNGNYIKNGASGSGSWTQSLDRTSAVQAQVNKIQVNSLTTPSPNPDTATLLISRYPTVVYVNNNTTWCISDSPATFSGYINGFSISLTGADAARTVNFYVATNNGGGSFTATYDSGAIPMTVAGVNTYTPPDFTAVNVLSSQVICAYVHATAVASTIQYYSSGGPAVQAAYAVAAPMVLGTPSTQTVQLTSRWFPISATVIDHDTYVAKRWADQAGGYPSLNTTGIQILPVPTASIRPSVLPAYLRNSTMPQVNGNSNLVSSFDASLPYTSATTNNKISLQPNSAVATIGSALPSSACGPAGSDATSYPGTRLVASYDITQPQQGFPAGILTSCRFTATAVATAGANVQAWVIRPPAGGFPTTGTPSSSFTVVAQIGELDDATNGTYDELTGLTIPVQAGDLVAFRVANRGLLYGASSTTCNTTFRELAFTSAQIPSLADTSLNALMPGQVVNYNWTNSARQYLYSCNVHPGPSFAVGNQPGTVLRLDNNGNIPDSIGRSADTYWKGKKIIWVGTSIPATGDTTTAAYPVLVGNGLQSNMDNQSVGSSHITWDSSAPSNCLSLIATQAQLTAAAGCGSAFTVQSYEGKVMGKHADMLVIDHGHNDVPSPIPLGTINDLAPTYSSTVPGPLSSTYSSNGSTLTVTAPNNFTAGAIVLFSAVPTDALAPVTQKTFAVLGAGLSSTQFSVTTSLIAASSGTTMATAALQTTFYGAEQALISAAYADNPYIRIVLVMPPKTIDRGYTPPLDMTNVRSAISAIALRWQLPVVDLAALDGFNDTNYCKQTTPGQTPPVPPNCIYSADGIHPTYGPARQILARILYGAIKDTY